jgi:hypothetical protein
MGGKSEEMETKGKYQDKMEYFLEEVRVLWGLYITIK